MAKFGLRAIVICAAIALLLLSLFSDLTPVRVNGFGDATVGEEVSVDCMVVSCNHSKTGLIMTAIDMNGVEASIYLQPSVLAESVPAGAAIRVAVTPSEEDPMFMYASSVELLTYPETQSL